MLPEILCAAEPGLVLGFHGCEAEVRDAVLSGRQMLRPSRNPYDWLGHGYYFWMSNYERAIDFARNPPGKQRFREPAVLGAVLTLGNCLDLLSRSGLEDVRRAHRGWRVGAGKHASGAVAPVVNSADLMLRYLDCDVLEYLHDRRTYTGDAPYDSVRGVFVEGKPVYEGAGIYDKTHVQICIRNPNCILGFFKPRERMHWS